MNDPTAQKAVSNIMRRHRAEHKDKNKRRQEYRAWRAAGLKK